jgi:hypothetical protein
MVHNWELMLFYKTSQASPLYKSLAYSLVSFISGLWWVSLADYLLVLMTLLPLLLQMVRCTMGIASTVCTRWWTTTRTNGNGHFVYLIPCFCGLWLSIGTVSELSVCVGVVLKLLASAMLIWTRVVITLYSELRCIQLLLRTLCTMWRWLLNQYDLGWNVGWLEIFRDFTESRVVRA